MALFVPATKGTLEKDHVEAESAVGFCPGLLADRRLYPVRRQDPGVDDSPGHYRERRDQLQFEFSRKAVFGLPAN